MMQKNAIPPHVGIKTIINQTFPKDLDERKLVSLRSRGDEDFLMYIVFTLH